MVRLYFSYIVILVTISVKLSFGTSQSGVTLFDRYLR